jgi:hypothetical protein
MKYKDLQKPVPSVDIMKFQTRKKSGYNKEQRTIHIAI